MKQLVVLSGKGGTGKTSFSASFAHLASSGTPGFRSVLADVDVDAANLEFVLAPEVLETHDFEGGQIAVIDQDACGACGTCQMVCRFDAVISTEDGYQIDPIDCEGCAACMYQCPFEAISMITQMAGKWYRSKTRFGTLFHAALKPAQENSGKLVTRVKEEARRTAMAEFTELVIVDGPPGIGCPVISAVSGIDVALIVAEPSAAGIHDMERVISTTAHFGVQTFVCINKFDISEKGTAEIEAFCSEQDIQVLGRIPFDIKVPEAMVDGKPVTLYAPESPSSVAIRGVWRELAEIIQEDK